MREIRDGSGLAGAPRKWNFDENEVKKGWKNRTADEILERITENDGFKDREENRETNRVATYTSSKKYTKWGAMKATADSLISGKADFANKDPFKYNKKTKRIEIDHSDGAKMDKSTESLNKTVSIFAEFFKN